MRGAKSAVVVAAASLFLAGAAQGYYHFVHYASREGPYTRIPEKFNLSALFNNTLPYVISDQGPAILADGDSYTSVVSQIRRAAESWNAVQTSQLRLAFGGYFTPGNEVGSSPVVEVVFEDVPPGLVALGGPEIVGDPIDGPEGAFAPILKSNVILRRDLSDRPSWRTGFLLSVAHEFGHALGLQHTLTSGLMSTEITRATTAARPVAADDAAGVSLLYPAPGFLEQTGSISGRVSSGGAGMNLASVVAIAPEGDAVSALTDPDGSYRIAGLPPGSYYVYVHPLPPPLFGETYPANVVPPKDPEGNPFPASGYFETLFYPGVKDTTQASILSVAGGQGIEGVDFEVVGRATPPVSSVQTYSFPGDVAVKPAHVGVQYGRNLVVASGTGLMQDGAVAPGLGVQVLGGSPSLVLNGIGPYATDPRFLELGFTLDPAAGAEPRHLVFSRDNDIYVLPAGVRVTNQAPPSIGSIALSVTPEGTPVVILEGSGFTGGTSIFFDGARATVLSAEPTVMTVAPPDALAGHLSAVTAVNADGQTSQFLAPGPAFYTHEGSSGGTVAVAPNSLTAGVEGVVQILGEDTHFGPGSRVSFGSSDVVVRQAWVLSPTRIVANVGVLPGALTAPSTVTVTSGLREWSAVAAFQPGAGEGAPTVSSPVVDSVYWRVDIPAGMVALVRLANLAPDVTASNIQVTLNEVPAPVVGYEEGVLSFVVPKGVGPGVVALRITAGGQQLPTVAISVDLPAPVVLGVVSGASTVSANRPAQRGVKIAVVATELGEAGSDKSRLQVWVGGVYHPVLKIMHTDSGTLLEFELSTAVPSGDQPLILVADGRLSTPFHIAVAGQ